MPALAACLLWFGLTSPAHAAPGDFDSTFSSDGKETTDFGKDDAGSGIAVQADGKIVVAGTSRFELTQCGDNGCESESHVDSALARYNPDGSLDTSFSGDGKETTDFGGYYDVALQPDGKIVVVGTEGFRRCVDIWCDNFAQFAVARYNADGSLDTSFSDDGKQSTVFGCCENGARGVALQPDGKIVAVGRTGGDDFALARYNADGSLDTSFSDDGTQTTDVAGWDDGRAVAIQGDGKILAVGTTNAGPPFAGDDDFALARYNADGSLDSSFSGDGKQDTDFGSHEDGRGVALQPDGRIVAAGYSTAGGDTGFALARYNADGTLDTSFSGDGKQNSGFGHTAFDVALQPDGKLVAAGSSGDGNFALARYEGGSGPPDTDPPETTATGGPTGVTNDSTPTFSFESSESGSTFECRVDDGAFSSCSSPHTTSPLSDGSHTFEVRAIDQAGNADSSPAIRGFTVDATPPETTITGGPTGTTKDDTPTFSFSSNEAGSRFECRVDGGAFSPCSSPHTTASLSGGSHTFEVRAIDPAGNVDPSPASRSFTVARKGKASITRLNSTPWPQESLAISSAPTPTGHRAAAVRRCRQAYRRDVRRDGRRRALKKRRVCLRRAGKLPL